MEKLTKGEKLFFKSSLLIIFILNFSFQITFEQEYREVRIEFLKSSFKKDDDQKLKI